MSAHELREMAHEVVAALEEFYPEPTPRFRYQDQHGRYFADDFTLAGLIYFTATRERLNRHLMYSLLSYAETVFCAKVPAQV